MRGLILGCLVVTVVLPLAGCGGALTQEDMRKAAIRRKRDGEEEPKSPAAAPGKTPGAAKQNAAAKTRRDVAAESPSVDAVAASRPQAGAVAAPANGTVKQPAGQAGTAATAPTPPPRPTQPLTLVERRQRSLDNLARLGEGIRRYTQEKKQLFMPARQGVGAKPLLSWRVELLPYLGYEQLYREFKLDEPWDSPHNSALLARIPEVFQSPERFDEQTNYVLPVASCTPFGQLPPGVSLALIEDGPESTVAVVEVDDATAVPWTKPADLEFSPSQFRAHTGTLREDGVFVIWLDGSVGRILHGCTDADLLAAFTYDSGDAFDAYLARAEATAEPAKKLATPVADAAAPKADAHTDDDPGVAAPAAMPIQPRSPESSAPAIAKAERKRLPVPNPLSLEQARQLVRELYQKEYESQQDAQQQRAMAQRMLQQADQMADDPAGQYVLLDVALKIATRVGDTSTAMSALDRLVDYFAVDELEKTHETLVALSKKDRDRTSGTKVLSKARDLIDRAIREERFDIAESLCQIATAAARQSGDREAASQLVQQAAHLAECEKAFRDVRRVLASATDASDPEGSLRVGSYYCFIRGEWDKGLPLLAQGSHVQLRELAEAELKQPTIPEDQLRLADGWWQLADDDPAHKLPLRDRAAYWYEHALPALPQGLWRAKAEMRLKEHRRSTGKDESASSLTISAD